MFAILDALRSRLLAPPARRVLVAAVLDSQLVVLNVGSDGGAHLGQRFALLDDGIPITYEGEYLGAHHRAPVVVTVIEAQERLVVARLRYAHQSQAPWSYREPRRPVLPGWVAIGARAAAIGD